MKNGLGNLMASNAGQLAAIVRNRLKRIQYRPALIDGFLAQTGRPAGMVELSGRVGHGYPMGPGSGDRVLWV